MKLLLIYNTNPLYRKAIFTQIDKTFNCDWLFGDSLGDIKRFDLNGFRGNVSKGQIVSFLSGRLYWQKKVVGQLFKGYSHYIILGEERALSTWLFILLSRFFPKKKVYFWTHGPYGKEGFIKRAIQLVFYRLVDGGFVYGNYSRNILIQRGLNAEKFVTIHNSLDYDNQVALRNSGLESNLYRQHFGNDNSILLFIGRLTKVKKLDMLIDAVNKMSIQGNSYNLVFVGDGSERDALENKVKEYSLEKQVWFYGACYDEKENAELIYNADLCVAPGNVGLTAMHTMVFGTPVISHNNFPWQMPEFEAIQPGVTGDFFEMDNIESLVNTIQKWFSSGKDRETIRQACYNEIDSQWNPYFQINVLKQKLS